MKDDNNCSVYILHFDRPYWRAGRNNCQHYTGFTTKPYTERIDVHRSGKGSRLVRYALNKGIDFRVVYVEVGLSRRDAQSCELRIKSNNLAKRFCCLCNKGAKEL